MLDPAMCRPGRLDKLLYVDLPAPEERAEIIRTLLAGSRTRSRVPLLSPQVGEDVAVMVGGPQGDGYSGADLAALVREAGVRALRRALGTLEEMDSRLGASSGEAGTAVVVAAVEVGEKKDAEGATVVLFEDFQAAWGKVAPSVSKTQRRRYEALRETFASGGIGGREGKERVL
jgi:ribosome biogenesis ATPase